LGTTRADLVSRNLEVNPTKKRQLEQQTKACQRRSYHHNIRTSSMKNIFILDHPPSPQGIKLNTNKPKIEENREPCHLVAMWYKYWSSWSYYLIHH